MGWVAAGKGYCEIGCYKAGCCRVSSWGGDRGLGH